MAKFAAGDKERIFVGYMLKSSLGHDQTSDLVLPVSPEAPEAPEAPEWPLGAAACESAARAPRQFKIQAT